MKKLFKRIYNFIIGEPSDLDYPSEKIRLHKDWPLYGYHMPEASQVEGKAKPHEISTRDIVFALCKYLKVNVCLMSPDWKKVEIRPREEDESKEGIMEHTESNPTERLCELVRICLMCENLSRVQADALKVALFDCEHQKSEPK